MDADGGEDPFAVVQLVLRVGVERELLGQSLHELSNPTDLHPAREARTIDSILGSD